MEDCTQAINSEELHADDLDLDLREFKLFTSNCCSEQNV